MMPLDPLIA